MLFHAATLPEPQGQFRHYPDSSLVLTSLLLGSAGAQNDNPIALIGSAKAVPFRYKFFFAHCSMRSSALSMFAIELATLNRK